MNQQEIFNKMVAGLETQGFQQSRNEYGCKFRGHEGRKCALGHLVTDEELNALRYQPDREPLSVDVSSYLLLKFGSVGDQKEALSDQNLLWKTQLAHDSGRDPALMKELLAKVAKDFGLTAPPSLGFDRKP